MKNSPKAWLNALFFVITLLINTLGAIGIINGLTQKQVSDMYPTLITPSSITFSIWGIIYVLLLISILLIIIKRHDSYYQMMKERISGLFILSSIFNCLWIISFSYLYLELSVLFIFALTITIVLICKILFDYDHRHRFLLALTFGLYAGWLVIATVVNVAATLVKIEWNSFGLSHEIITIVVLAAAILIVILITASIRNAAFPLPIAWAYFGIYQSLTIQPQSTLLATIVLAGCAILVVVALINYYRNQFAILPKI
ncbi:MAG: tryptophan-rich sensory protein [Erysipelotrichaceae bacterium]|nr:tryptophan-rich sensory protein [Erysipelotrichaceae bacterium]